MQDVINISTDGLFVAVAIGYGFEEDRERPLVGPEIAAATRRPRSRSSSAISECATCRCGSLIEGFRVNPKFAPWMFW